MDDIKSKEDINILVDAFYKDVLKDDIIGFFFTDVINLDWEKHLPIMYSFWESILLETVSYRGNPMLKHLELNNKNKIEPKHFDQWLSIWESTVRTHFMGHTAENAIERAKQIAGLMKYKIEQSRNEKFIL